MASPSQSFTINGIKVQFPCQPYPSQLAMMNKITKGLNCRQNCLLESPTGSGKSLALLCSALAWQQAEKEKIRQEEEADKKKGGCTCQQGSGMNNQQTTSGYFSEAGNAASTTAMMPPSLANKLNKPPGQERRQSGENCMSLNTSEDDDFKPLGKKLRTSLGGTIQSGRGHVSVQYEGEVAGQEGVPPPGPPAWSMELQHTDPSMDMGACCDCACQAGAKPSKKKVPKIYFGTRTHKQIAQITKELRRTAYNHVQMTILSSREHTCIDPEVSRCSNKNEECKNKLDSVGCRYKEQVRRVTNRALVNHGLGSGWDLEDFIGFCHKQRACPYFGARELKMTADVIFCPYNYLTDPIIRSSMEINLKDQIVILDEAHNIEDSSREAASISITQKQLQEAFDDLQKMVDNHIKPEGHMVLKHMCMNIDNMIKQQEEHLTGGSDYDNVHKVWSGMDMVAQLQLAGVGPDDMPTLGKHYKDINEDDPDKEDVMKLKTATHTVLEGIFMVLNNIYKDNMNFMPDYRMAMVRTMVYTNENTNGRWLGKRRRGGHQRLSFTFTLHFWCMNPAVAFSDLGSDTRSIVLTSGTLSPMNSFQSELGVPFPIQLEAPHVIGKSQVWVGAVSRGPRGSTLLGNYQNTETFDYQDEIGQLVLQVSQTIPHGVLCFLSSYKMVEKLTKRWKNTGLYDQLGKHKLVMIEPRGGDKSDFDTLLKHFYNVIQETSQPENCSNGITGALLFAVCRGKVSEGMDFTDNNARAVITVGIPFPNVKDQQVELKKQYNNQYSSSRGLLSGSAWYEIQAYRALNQALGRCIRHKKDWGALILVDERYAKNPNRYTSGLSKWVRQRVQYYNTFQQAQNSLKDYTQIRLEEDKNGGANDVSVMDVTLNDSVVAAMTPQRPDFKTPYRTTPVHDVTNARTPQSCQSNTSEVMKQPKEVYSIFTPLRPKSGQTSPETPTIVNKGGKQKSKALNKIDERYINPSQAGGFLPSQTMVDQSASQHPDLTSQEVVISGSLDEISTYTDLAHQNVIVDFQPPVASTQMSQRKKSITPSKIDSIQSNLNPTKLVQQGTPASMKSRTSDCPGFKDKLSQFSFSKNKKDTNNLPEACMSTTMKNKKELYQFVSIDGNCPNKKSPKKEMKQEQAHCPGSPILFDSDPMDLPPDEIDAVLKEIKVANVECPIKSAEVKVRETNLSRKGTIPPVTPGRKPLFKSAASEEMESAVGKESTGKSGFIIEKTGNKKSNQECTTSDRRSLSRSRLSRKKGSFCQESDKSTMALDNSAVFDMSNEVKVETSDDSFFLKGIEDISNTEKEESELVIKRGGRSKRRRVASQKTATSKKQKGVNFIDEQEDEKTTVIPVCKMCGSPFLKTDCVNVAEVRPEAPSFLSCMKSSRNGVIVTSENDIQNVEKLHIQTLGITLNSYWSEQDDCAVEYLQCKKQCDIVGAVIKSVGPKAVKLKSGQVWLTNNRL